MAWAIALLKQIVDHPLESELAAVVRRVHTRDAVPEQFVDLGRENRAAATSEDLDVTGAALAQQVEHVLEVLDVAALIRGHRDRLRILLDGAIDDLGHRAVVAEMDDLGPGGLQYSPHDVDGGVVAIEQRRGGNDANVIVRLVGLDPIRHPAPLGAWSKTEF